MNARLPILAIFGMTLLVNASSSAAQDLSLTVHEYFISRFSHDVALGDLNGDRRVDLILTNTSVPSIDLFLGISSGRFQHVGTSGLASMPGRPVVHDIDRDGAGDIVLGSTFSNRIVTVLWGDGSSGIDRYPETRFGVEEAIHSFSFLDHDGDGHLDFIATVGTEAILGPGKVVFFPGRIGRTFGGPRTLGTGIYFTDHVEGDFDGDQHIDLVVADRYADTVTVFLGSSDGSFIPYGSFSLESPSQLSSADMNGDGSLDLVVTQGGLASSQVFLGDGMGRFTLAATVEVDSTIGGAIALELDGDGFLDLAVLDCGECSGHGGGALFFYFGGGDGEFTLGTILELGYGASKIVAIDLDSDAVDDLVVLEENGFRVLINETFAATTPRGGSVNAGIGEITDVLFLNENPGSGEDRRVEYDVFGSIELRMSRPPAVPAFEVAPYALYLWPVAPSPSQVTPLPFRIGRSAMPMPLSGGPPPPVIWNNAGRVAKLGIATKPSQPAPGVFFSRTRLRRVGRFYIQGLIFDPGSQASVPASVTNGIVGVPVFR